MTIYGHTIPGQNLLLLCNTSSKMCYYDHVILDAETKIPSSITAYGAGYINQNLEKIIRDHALSPL